MSKIKIFSLGGLNENGKNMYIVDVDDSIFVFDAGLKYPSDNLLGVDYIIPSLEYLMTNKEKIKGIFITHGHEGNMGALPDILKELPDISVYATKFTMEMLRIELNKKRVKATSLKEIRPHSKIDVGGYSIFPVNITHSIPEAVAYVLYTNDGAIVYATDFVFDSIMPSAYKTDIGKLAYVGKQGVLCLLAESVYAYREGFTSPNHRISEVVWDVVSETENRVFITIFAEHIYRIQEVFDEISRTKRKVVIIGKYLNDVINKAYDNEFLKFDKEILGNLDNLSDKDVVVLLPDDKEKNYASLEKIISGYDRYIKFCDTDTVFVSEPVYPGNEKKIAKIMDDLARLGVNAVSLSNKKHLLHHASKEDLMQLINLINPKYYFPIKGEYRYMYMNALLAEQVGLDKNNILLKLNGDVATFIDGNLTDDNEKVSAQELLIDGTSLDDIGELVLKDRQILSKSGIVIISATINRETKQIESNPQILTRGFIYVKSNLEMIEKAIEISKAVILNNVVEGQKTDFAKIKQKIREELGDYFYAETGALPMILTVILEV